MTKNRADKPSLNSLNVFLIRDYVFGNGFVYSRADATTIYVR